MKYYTSKKDVIQATNIDRTVVLHMNDRGNFQLADDGWKSPTSRYIKTNEQMNITLE